ncbi:response regulator [Membranihabitans marinus]|uniref:response regulator n=1 Tax=Membranihabitans marinus TaxID=1227546 RepID=UPI001F21EF4F|nr:response regulator transcription factor [Membranihabitans marinus]
MTEILVVEDHHILQVGIRIMFNELNIRHEIFFAATYPEAIAKLSNHKIGLIILDLNVPGGNNAKMIEVIKMRYPDIKILVFSSLNENVYAQQCLRYGAHGFVSKSSPESDFKKAVVKVLNNQIYVSDYIQQDLLTSMNESNKEIVTNPLKALSPRETDIVNLIIQGLSTSEISNNLNLQSSTVSTYKNRIYKKLGVNNVVELIHKVNSLSEK